VDLRFHENNTANESDLTSKFLRPYYYRHPCERKDPAGEGVKGWYSFLICFRAYLARSMINTFTSLKNSSWEDLHGTSVEALRC